MKITAEKGTAPAFKSVWRPSPVHAAVLCFWLLLLVMTLIAGTECLIIRSTAVRFGGSAYLDGIQRAMVLVMGVVNAA